MKTRSHLSLVVLAAIAASLSVVATAQESFENASWGQMKALLQDSRGQIGGSALGMTSAAAEPTESDESDLLTTLDQEILALPQIRGTYEQVCEELKELGIRIESFASDEEAERVLCSAGEGIAFSRLTDEGECPAVQR